MAEPTTVTAQFEELPDAPPRRKLKLSWSGKLAVCVVSFWIVIAFIAVSYTHLTLPTIYSV